MTDEELIERLRGAFPPVPDRLRAVGLAAFDWLLPDATLATLAYDAADAPAGVRGGEPRTLTFAGRDVRVEIEVCGREIVGQLAPAADAEVILRSPGGERGTRTDESGGFVLSEVPAGLVSLLFRPADGTSIVTSWIHV
ncbi:carboxypeptidase-like regulatory domain-containing protein [Actinoallomurus soli]|uniref:carboxypeptidase-like regulatory domain-containing protein n=1 Tax=Actinoallomurus soli TaxID=2952535 RepID=UPI0020927653|nr:carboxypeptidase-like regulatory domain-containing protein [Actinoallomurus soli]MCO5970739.1 carboxypeptidase-like regulatory domain-containing protein [Actinoallomurus soli]